MWDLVNAFWELFGGLFIAISIRKLLREKQVRGVSYVHVSYFTAWGIWNLAYYPHLGEWFSLIGCGLVLLANFIWLFLLVWYSRKDKHES